MTTATGICVSCIIAYWEVASWGFEKDYEREEELI